ncbi:exported hypothetical protein [metagenome]|uniref:Uncharacterized protein n=1 Tax=metagenome TaxID=256318 RepID=A0A2P2C0T9_9ZZZZ
MKSVHISAFAIAGGLLASTLATANPQVAVSKAGGPMSCRPSTGVSGYVGSADAATRVDLYAEPKPTAMKVGDASYLTHLGSSQVSQDGCYAIAWPAAKSLRRAADPYGVLNLRLVVQRGPRLEMRVFPGFLSSSDDGFLLRSTQGAAARRPLGRLASDEQGAVSGRLTQSFSSASAESMRLDDSVSLRGRAAPLEVHRSDLATLPRRLAWQASSGTRYVLERRFRDRPVAVGQFWSNTKRSRERWVYADGASSSLGAAWSVSGVNGSYSASQTWTTSTDNSMGFPKARGKAHRIYRTFFSYGKFAYQVYDYINGRWRTVGHIVRRIRWEGGIGTLKGPRTPTSPQNYCKPFRKGTDWDSGTTHAMTWSDGVSLSAGMKDVLGSVTLSSSSGFSRLAHNHVAFVGKARLCGLHGGLTDRPGALIARRP